MKFLITLFILFVVAIFGTSAYYGVDVIDASIQVVQTLVDSVKVFTETLSSWLQSAKGVQ